MDAGTKRALLARLGRVEGQARAISRMLDEDRDCVDVLLQISAAQGALGKIGEVLLASHIEHCVSEAFESGDEEARTRSISELMDIFGRYGGLASR
jgi:DNA-binding FrmR family transcriptional regulator